MLWRKQNNQDNQAIVMKKVPLFLIHFAGGNCYSFDFMKGLLREFEVVPLELPGRGRRISEGLVKDFDLAALDIYNQIARRPALPSRYLIYGHSMGAYLALRVSNLLERSIYPPSYLIVSGNPGPGIKEDRGPKRRYLMAREELIGELEGLGGMSEELLANADLFDYYEPVLRADFEVAERNELSDEPATTCPLYALMGNQEEQANKIVNWSKFTKSSFKFEILEGDHFFIRRHPERLARIITECCYSTYRN
jgi:external thioesterase TEII